MKKFLYFSLGALLLTATLSLTASAQIIDPTVKTLQDQIQLLLSQMQTLQQQINSLQAGSANQTTITPNTPTIKPAPIIPPALTSDLDIDESEISQTETEFVPPPTLTRSLTRGSRGEDVRQLQEFLAQDSTIYPEGLATGYYGIGTEAAVKKWQAKNGLPSVGIVGRQTIAKFKTIYSGATNRSQQPSTSARPDAYASPIYTVPSQPITTIPETIPQISKEICPAMPTINSCPANEEKTISYKSEQCGVYYTCKPKISTRTENTVAALKKTSSIQTDERYIIILNDPEGIQRFSVYNTKGAQILSGYPACRTDWTSPTASIASSEFPLKLTLTDCGNPSSQFSTALSTPVIIQSTSGTITFPYTFSNGKIVYSSEEARTYCYANGSNNTQGIASECETKFGISYTNVAPINTTTTSATSSRAYYLTAVFESCMSKYGFLADAKQIKIWAQLTDPIPWQNLSSGAQTSVSACEREYYGTAQTSPTTTTTTSPTTITQPTTTTQPIATAVPPTGQKEQIWNTLGLRSWIRTDADSARIEQLKQACASVAGGSNIWAANAGVYSSADFGMPNADKCRLASACSYNQSFNGTSCVSNSTTASNYSSSYSYVGDANSCPGFSYSRWDSSGRRYCQLNTETKCDYNYPSYLTNGTNYSSANCPASNTSYGGSAILSCSTSVPAWPVQYGNYCLNNSRTQYVPLSSPITSSAQSCTGNNSPIDGCTPPGGGTNSSSSCGAGYYWNGSSCLSSSNVTGSSCPSGQYWNGNTCMTSTTSNTSCSGGQYWNGNSCVNSSSSGTYSSDPSTACAQAGGSWNTSSNYCQMPAASGSSSSCPAGQYWNGNACVNTSTTDCTSGQYWNGSSCVSSTPSSSGNTSSTTTACPSGNYWNGTACVPSTPPTCPSDNYWNGSACVPSSTTSTTCSSGQYWNGTACVSSTSPTSAISNPPLANILETLNSILQKLKILTQ